MSGSNGRTMNGAAAARAKVAPPPRGGVLAEMRRRREPSVLTCAGGRVRWHTGTIGHWLPQFRAKSFHASLSDPPYELGFMGAGWDKRGVAFDPQTWRMLLRVLRPGAYALAFGGTRTSHRLTCAAEDAGFWVGDAMLWLHGQGFPKSLDVAKSIDKAAGATRRKVAATGGLHKNRNLNDDGWSKIGTSDPVMDGPEPVTELARLWEGYGTALKPAWEPVPLLQRPLDGTYAQNVAKHHCGALNIGGCRIGAELITVRGGGGKVYDGKKSCFPVGEVNETRLGRFPANLQLSHTPYCRKVGVKVVKTAMFGGNPNGRKNTVFGRDARPQPPGGYGDADGNETVEHWQCHPRCPVRLLDVQSGGAGGHDVRRSQPGTRPGGFGGVGADKGSPVPCGPLYADGGGASRFFYTPKASRFERDHGLDGVPLKECDNFGDDAWGRANRKVGHAANDHSCVKPLSLCWYYATLLLPPPKPGVVRRLCVPFAGSGSEVLGALLAGWDEVWAIEQDPKWATIAPKRIEAALAAGLS